MKRGNSKKTKTGGRSQKSPIQTSIENQIAMRGSRKLGSALALYALKYINRPDYTVVRTYNPARVNRQGTTYVSAHTRRTIEPTRSDWGRGFKQTDSPARKRQVATSQYRVGRLIPYLGIGYMAYNLGTNWGSQEKDSEMRPREEGFWLYDIAVGSEYVVRNTVKAGIVNTLTAGVFSAGDLID